MRANAAPTCAKRPALRTSHFRLGRPRLTIKAKSGSLEEIEAEYLLDCSGRHSVLGTQLGLKREYAGLQKFAVYAHYVGAQQPSGIDGTLTRMVRGKDHWFWIIPLSAEKISVGVVMDTQRYRSLRRSPAEVLDMFLAEQPIMRERLSGARRVSKVYASGDYSYRNSSLHGDRWLMAGDAAGFIDPIFSSGVFLAILSGEKAAEAIDRSADSPASGEQAFRSLRAPSGQDHAAVSEVRLLLVSSGVRRDSSRSA